MSQQPCVQSTVSVQAASRLASVYDELTRVDRQLREAEGRLAAAHSLSAQQLGAEQTQVAYLEVLALRERAQRVLVELAEIWIADR